MAAQQAEAEDSLAQDLQLTPENSDDEDRPGKSYTGGSRGGGRLGFRARSRLVSKVDREIDSKL